MNTTIKRRKRIFSRVYFLLDRLQALHVSMSDKLTVDRQITETLKHSQYLLIKEVSRAERKIRRTKTILQETHPDSDTADAAAARLEYYRNLRYSWLCFGDAIAFLFMDKYALKHTYFNTDNQNPKQDSGFISDKSGLESEISQLIGLLDDGVPALLCDLTNTIRHGDICIMTAQDPRLIEVKSGGVNNRGRRQIKSIKKLTRFFDTDIGNGLRGYEVLTRVAPEAIEVIYLGALNRCIEIAYRSKAAWCSPEDGLFYLVIRVGDVDISNIFEDMKLSAPTIFFLNQAKSARAWAPYSPFTLSIFSEEALFDFIWGELMIFVIYETSKLQRIAEAKGLTMTILDEDSEYMFEIVVPQSDGWVRVSKQMFSRVAMDFVSPEWILQASIEKI